jgi:hypothetical protein
MQVVDFGSNDRYEARCTACGWRRQGALEVKRLIRKSGIGTLHDRQKVKDDIT